MALRRHSLQIQNFNKTPYLDFRGHLKVPSLASAVIGLKSTQDWDITADSYLPPRVSNFLFMLKVIGCI